MSGGAIEQQYWANAGDDVVGRDCETMSYRNSSKTRIIFNGNFEVRTSWLGIMTTGVG